MYPAKVLAWKPWLEKYAGDIPIDVALNWSTNESGGNVCATGVIQGSHVQEAGLAQTYFATPSSVVNGFTSSQLRASCSGTSQTQTRALTDAERDAHAKHTIAEIKDHRAAARRYLVAADVQWSESSSDFWCFVKLHHCLPVLYYFLEPAARAGAASTWKAFTSYVDGLGRAQLDAVHKSAFPYRDPVRAFGRFWSNCEKTAGAGGFLAGVGELGLMVGLAIVALVFHRFIF